MSENNVVWGPFQYREPPKRERYSGPRINRKKRRLGLNALLEEFDTQGIRAVMIIGIPYNENDVPTISELGGDRNDWLKTLEEVRDAHKGVLYYESIEELDFED